MRVFRFAHSFGDAGGLQARGRGTSENETGPRWTRIKFVVLGEKKSGLVARAMLVTGGWGREKRECGETEMRKLSSFADSLIWVLGRRGCGQRAAYEIVGVRVWKW